MAEDRVGIIEIGFSHYNVMHSNICISKHLPSKKYLADEWNKRNDIKTIILSKNEQIEKLQKEIDDLKLKKDESK